MDIGANLGWYSFVMASKGFKTFAFEPLPENIFAMRYALSKQPYLNERIELFEYGLGNKNERCALFTIEANSQNGMVDCNPNFILPPDGTLGAYLNIVLLDSFLPLF